MDKIALVYSIFLLGIATKIHASCEVEGIDDFYYDYTIPEPIEDTFRGEIATFKTKNIIRAKPSRQSYVKSSFSNQTLHLYTADNFDRYEDDFDGSRSRILIEFYFECNDDNYERTTIYQNVIDTNNHAPALNKERYDYHFNMSLPKGTILTNIIPIKAYDPDMTNNKINFTIEENEFVKLDREGRGDYGRKNFETTLTILEDIKPPFNKEFTLVVTDNGTPPQSTKVPLTIAVGKTEEETPSSHPPVFSQHLYMASYNSKHEFQVEEPIVIKHGFESNSVLNQAGYEQYFKVRFGDDEHKTILIEKLTDLKTDILNSVDYITFEIEVENAGLSHMPGRTAVLVKLPQLNPSTKMVNLQVNSPEGHTPEGHTPGNNFDEGRHTVVENYFHSNNGQVIFLVLFLFTVFCIAFINVFVIIMFVKNKIVFLK